MIHSKTLVVLLIALLFLMVIVACDPENRVAEQPSTVRPTLTVLPAIPTDAPRVTATLPPSATLTPSQTATPSDTPTPITPTATFTATSTPPVLANVVADNPIRVRDEPSFQADIIATADQNTQVEIHYTNEAGDWMFVRFVDAEGNTVEGWMDVQFLEWGGAYVPPTFGPSPTVTPTIDPNITPSPTPAATVSEESSNKNVRANCLQVDEDPPAITAAETVSIWWWWYAKEESQLDDHVRHASYEILLDGRLLENGEYGAFQTQYTQETVDGRREWVVRWYVPVGTLTPGRHEVTYRLTWDAEISDGYATFSPDTPDTSNCVFVVSE